MTGTPAPLSTSAGRPDAQAGPASAAGAGTTPAERFRVALEYAIVGDLRYLAHHDELRMLTRALVRAKWPLAYTHGFNPRPRLTLALPRNLGTESTCQLAVVELSAPCPPAELFARLAAVLPGGCRLQRVCAPLPPTTPHAQRATYEVELAPRDAAVAASQIAALLARPSVVVERVGAPNEPSRPFEIRPYIDRIELAGGALRLTLRVTPQGSARPAEVLTALGLAPDEYSHRLRRTAVQWDIELSGPPTGPAAHERKPLEQETHEKEDRGRAQDGQRG